MLKVALVWPPGFDREYAVPLALGYLKSNVPSGNAETACWKEPPPTAPS